MGETEEKRIIPENFLLKVGMDTSTLIRLFKGSWKTAEISLYQTFFITKIAPTVYEEFLNFQDSESLQKLNVKKKFLKKILKAEVVLPEYLEVNGENESLEVKVFKEYLEMDIDFLLTDDEEFEEQIEELNGIEILNAKHIWWKFGEFKK